MADADHVWPVHNPARNAGTFVTMAHYHRPGG